jgi:hypothetical protein
MIFNKEVEVLGEHPQVEVIIMVRAEVQLHQMLIR